MKRMMIVLLNVVLNAVMNRHNFKTLVFLVLLMSGVHQAKDRKWVASIRINKKRTCLGRFEKKEDAVIERLKAEKEYYGEFASQKELFDKYDI